MWPSLSVGCGFPPSGCLPCCAMLGATKASCSMPGGRDRSLWQAHHCNSGCAWSRQRTWTVRHCPGLGEPQLLSPCHPLGSSSLLSALPLPWSLTWRWGRVGGRLRGKGALGRPGCIVGVLRLQCSLHAKRKEGNTNDGRALSLLRACSFPVPRRVSFDFSFSRHPGRGVCLCFRLGVCSVDREVTGD